MQTASYYSTINFIAEIAPTLDKPGEFIKWAEDICGILTHIYQGKQYDEVTEDLYNAVKEEQDFEGEDE